MKRKMDLQFFAEAAQKVDQEPNEQKSFLDFEADFKINAEEKGVIEGYASTYGNLDRQNDIIQAGAFKAAHGKKFPIFALHDPGKALGVGTVHEDEKGLKIKMKLEIENTDSDTLRERAKEYYAMAKAGIIQRMSVGFITKKHEWETKKEGERERYIRKILEAELLEVSLVPIPANDKARITSVKSDEKPSLQDLEKRIAELEAKLAEKPADNPAAAEPKPAAIAGGDPAAEDQKDGKTNEQTEQQTEQKTIEKKPLSAGYVIASRMGLF